MTHPNPTEALSKCVVYFNDGNSRTFYSFDKKHKKSKPNKALGIIRLEKMLLQHFKGTWETAIIYENKVNGKKLAKFKGGIRVF
ncbi:hypothetical protein [uncultured Aquimarina sp.]|uniref:hypothetical protein n=1 Tax=uncultured Aquimarina sp. TaxID=575652 RepID=UPI0026219CA3|nr:hypothetical protein [uncultured Aquimarina sp.]